MQRSGCVCPYNGEEMDMDVVYIPIRKPVVTPLGATAKAIEIRTLRDSDFSEDSFKKFYQTFDYVGD